MPRDMSDPERNAETELCDSSDSEHGSEHGGAMADAEPAQPKEESSVRAGPLASEPPISGARKRSSIRPAPAGWRSSAQAMSNPPRPMVVVYSGEGERPERWWEESAQPSDAPSLEGDTPVPPNPALSSREQRASAVQVDEPSPVADGEGDSSSDPVAAFSTIIPPAESASEGSATEAPVALSSVPSSLPPPSTSVPVRSVSEPPPELLAERRRAKRERASMIRRGAFVIAGAFLSAYLVTQRVALRDSGRTDAARANTPDPSAEALATQPQASAVTPSEQAAPPQASAVASTEAEPLLPPPSSESEADEAGAEPPSSPAKKSVVIEVVPWDAKVLLAGVAQPGPPFVVTIPEGKRVAFEVARKGYIPRRVVVDGSEEKLFVGLLRPKGARVEGLASGGVHAASESEDAAKDARVRVRSGL